MRLKTLNYTFTHLPSSNLQKAAVHMRFPLLFHNHVPQISAVTMQPDRYFMYLGGMIKLHNVYVTLYVQVKAFSNYPQRKELLHALRPTHQFQRMDGFRPLCH